MISIQNKLVLFLFGIAAVTMLLMVAGTDNDSRNDTYTSDEIEMDQPSVPYLMQADERTDTDIAVNGIRADGGRFEGVDTCKICHIYEYNGWSDTGHGKDFTPSSGIRPAINTYDLGNGPDYPGSCAFCHAVGIGNTDNGGFDMNERWDSTTPTADQKVGNVDLIGIQCESCHGPGENHVATSDKINNPMIIGNPSVEESCYNDGDSGCHGPDGHDKYTSWKASMHSNQDQLDKETAGGELHGVNSYCARCKSPSQYDPDTTFADAEEFTASEWHGIGCGDCHDSHSDEFEHQLRTTVEEACTVCHTNEKTEPVPGDAPNHSQKEAFDGHLGIGVSGQKGMAGVTCVDCHMWGTPEVSHGYYMSDAIDIQLRDAHAFEATAQACADCHSSLISEMPDHGRPDNNTGENEELWNEWDEWGMEWNETVDKWEMVIHDWQSDYSLISDSVKMNFAAADAALRSAEVNGNATEVTLAKVRGLLDDAQWNIGLTDDGSGGVHNPDFFTDLLNYANINSNMALKLLTTNGPPLAIAGNAKLGYVDEDLTFYGTLSSDRDGTITSYHWDYGDGTNDTTASATHSYSVGGVYLVTLTVTDNTGATDSDMITVFVRAALDIPEPLDLTTIENELSAIKQERKEMIQSVLVLDANLSDSRERDAKQITMNKNEIQDLDDQISQITGTLIVTLVVILILILLIYQIAMASMVREVQMNKDARLDASEHTAEQTEPEEHGKAEDEDKADIPEKSIEEKTKEAEGLQ